MLSFLSRVVFPVELHRDMWYSGSTVRWQTLQVVQNYLGQPNPKRD